MYNKDAVNLYTTLCLTGSLLTYIPRWPGTLLGDWLEFSSVFQAGDKIDVSALFDQPPAAASNVPPQSSLSNQNERDKVTGEPVVSVSLVRHVQSVSLVQASIF